MKFMVVEDNDSSREMLAKYLAVFNVEILQASNGAEGLEMFNSELPIITILDLGMPVMTGVEFLQKLNPDDLTTHFIIIMTGQIGDEEIETCYDLGAHAFLTKPVNLLDLKGAINRAIRLHNAFEDIEKLNRRLSLRQQDIPNALWETDTDLCLTYVEDSIETLLGISAEMMLGKPISDLIAEKDSTEFDLKFMGQEKQLKSEIKGLTLDFINGVGEAVPLQIFANTTAGPGNKTKGMVGIFRDMKAFTDLLPDIESSDDDLSISINKKGELIDIGTGVEPFINKNSVGEEKKRDFLQYLVDRSLEYLITFAFDQGEDVPFPVEINLLDEQKKEHHFSINFKFDSGTKSLIGILIPAGAHTNLSVAKQQMDQKNIKIENQEASLQDAVIVDDDIQKSILSDGINLSSEILKLVKSLDVYAFHPEGSFDIDEYGKFVQNRNLQIYTENLRLLGNKIHGLKGTCGFLIQEAKKLCHKIEDLTRPLTELKFALTQDHTKILKQYVFEVIDMLEEFEKDPSSKFTIGDWFEKIENTISNSAQFMGGNSERFAELINYRSIDTGEVRTRKSDGFLSVSLEGYEFLAEKVKDLFYSSVKVLPQEGIAEPSEHFNEFLTAHQQIKKVPVDLSRYERLIPKIAKDYEKSADFQFKDHRVKADREFWNAVHEILNHVLKNAVIHGIESEEERKKAAKEKEGKVVVELNEDAVHIYLTVSDDGRGINLEKIVNKAIEEKAVTRDQANHLSKTELFNLLFIQGVSTAESLDDNAGRGVGMNAVQEAMRLFNGNCKIESEEGQGSSWKFTFSKKNVSLQCVIIEVNGIAIAIPESFVETFIEYRDDNKVTMKGYPAYNYNQTFLPLIDTVKHLECSATEGGEAFCNVVVLKYQNEKKGMVINSILNSVILPIDPVPKSYREVSVYQGVALYNNTPVQVINIEKLLT